VTGPADPRHPWLTRNVKVLSAVSLAQDAASELLYPVLPILLTTVLGAPAAVVGIIEGIAEGIAAALKYVSGRASDRMGRKPAVATGYGLAAVGKVIIAAAFVWPLVLVGRVVDRIGKGIRGAPRDALLAQDVPNDAMGRVFGFHRAADTVGAVIGPLLGLLVLTLAGGNISVALWVAVIPAVISVALVSLVAEHREPPARSMTTDHEGRHQRTPAPPLPGRVRVVAGLLAVIALVNFPDALLLLRLNETGFTTMAVVATYALFNLSNALIAFPAGMLADRWPRARVYGIGLLCFAVGYLGLGLVDSGWVVVILLLVYGGFAGITDGVGKAWISGLAPPAVRGHAQGLLQGLTGGAILIAGLWAGLAWESGSGSGTTPLVISGTITIVAAVALLSLGRRLE
jgi:MFS family permease